MDAALRDGADHRPAAAALAAHLKHEEDAALPLIGTTHHERVGDDVPRYLPWLADPGTGGASTASPPRRTCRPHG